MLDKKLVILSSICAGKFRLQIIIFRVFLLDWFKQLFSVHFLKNTHALALNDNGLYRHKSQKLVREKVFERSNYESIPKFSKLKTSIYKIENESAKEKEVNVFFVNDAVQLNTVD